MTELKDAQEFESVCDTAEARTAMAAAINDHELVVKARAKEQV